MAGWETLSTPLIFNEGEDAEALLSQFIELSATWTNFNCFQIAEYVFKQAGIVDALMRSNQAALVWNDDLAVQVRIDKLKRNGGSEPEILTKERWEAELLALIRNDEITATMKSTMIKGYQLYGEGQGWIVKPVEKKTQDVTRRYPRIVMAQADAA